MSIPALKSKHEVRSVDAAKSRLTEMLVSGSSNMKEDNLILFPQRLPPNLHKHTKPIEVPATAEDISLLLPPLPEVPAWSKKPENMGAIEWMRNVFVGACILFVDSSIKAFKPVSFIWENMHIVAQATVVMMLPLLLTLAMIHHIPMVGSLYVPWSIQGGIYLVALYVSSSALLLLGRFAGVFAFKGAIKLLHRFAAYGAEHYPTR